LSIRDRLIRRFFVGPVRTPISSEDFCSPHSPSSNSWICSIRHFFLSLRSVICSFAFDV